MAHSFGVKHFDEASDHRSGIGFWKEIEAKQVLRYFLMRSCYWTTDGHTLATENGMQLLHDRNKYQHLSEENTILFLKQELDTAQ